VKLDEKRCPQCAETIKKAAHVCKHCGYRFSEEEMAATRKAEGLDQNWKAGCALVVIGLVAALAFCSPDKDASKSGAKDEASAPADPLADESAQMLWIVKSKDGIKARLRDPGSAEFRNVRFYSGGKAPAVCGEVNAKNGFGGYTGSKRFIASGEDLAFVEGDVKAGEFSNAWKALCVKADRDIAYVP
jgi:hypothetical protein